MIESKRKTVCSVVVTFNRKGLLIGCLRALVEQTKSLDTILIVDNASTDGTSQILLDQGYIQYLTSYKHLDHNKVDSKIVIKNNKNENIEIIYTRINENKGGAGGFYVGQKIAFELGYEWIWLMDDDGHPEKNCLYKLLESNHKNNLKASNPLVLNKENHSVLSFGLSESLISTQSVIKASKNGIILNKVNPFNGTLLHRELIKDVGFIKKEMFIWGDETEYFKRIEAFGYNYATVTAALFYHPTSKTNISKKLFGILKVQRKPEKLEMNFIRNQGYINVRYNSFLSHKVALIYFIYFLLDGTVNKAFISLAYYMDGMFNNFKLKNFR